MKKYIYLLTLILIASCGNKSPQGTADSIITEGNLENIRKKRKEVAAELKKLDDAITRLDTSRKNLLVTTMSIEEAVFTHYLEIQGNVETKENLVIYPEAGGILSRVFVKEGQAVKKGQVLAKIDDGGLAQQLAQIEVQMQLAKTTFERQKRLWDQKIGSEIQYLEAKTSFESQKNAVDQIKKQLAKTAIKAPFSGIIDDVITEQGSVVSPGQSQIIRLVNLDNMHITAEVPERHLTSITKGKYVEVFFPAIGKTLEANVRQVGNYINPDNRTFKIEIAVPNKEGYIKPNLTARLKINDYTNEKAILIPQSVISENSEGKQYAYITAYTEETDRTQAVRKIITTGKSQGDFVEVLSGLETGDKIVIEGARSIKDGQEIEVQDLKVAENE